MPWPRSRRHTALSAVGHVALEHAAGRRQPQPAHGEEVLERQRDPAQQRGRVALGGQPRVGGARQLVGDLGIEADPRVDGAGRPVEGRLAAVARGDPRLARLEQLDGRQRARAQERGGLEEAEVGGVGRAGVGHRRDASRAAWPRRRARRSRARRPGAWAAAPRPRSRPCCSPAAAKPAGRAMNHQCRCAPPSPQRPMWTRPISPTESTARSTRPSMTPCSRARSSGRSAGPSW